MQDWAQRQGDKPLDHKSIETTAQFPAAPQMNTKLWATLISLCDVGCEAFGNGQEQQQVHPRFLKIHESREAATGPTHGGCGHDGCHDQRKREGQGHGREEG